MNNAQLTDPAVAGARRLGPLTPWPDALHWDSERSPRDACAVAGGAVAVFLMIFWAIDDGGFDPGTWYWGALLLLASLAVVLVVIRGAVRTLPKPLKIALVLFALYVGWSYLSMSWASYPGLALQGSNRALLYLLMFAMMEALPWRRVTALLVIGAFGFGIGVVAIALLFRFSLGDSIPSLFLQGRLIAPTGYINSTAALFTVGALVAIALGSSRRLPGVLRGLMLAFASADLMLATTVQSRGWLFTLPLVGLWSIVVVAGRLRAIAAALIAAAGTLAAIRPMLRLFQIAEPAALTHTAVQSGKVGLLACAAVFAVGTMMAWVERARARPPLSRVLGRALGGGAALLTVAGIGGGLYIVSGHHPGSFLSRQWHGFTHEPSYYNTQSHFETVGSGRYDVWRSALDALRAHPIGGLGQDNFGDWYLTHRHTAEEPLWTHSLELRLLAHTGIVGFVLFFAFLACALVGAGIARRRGDTTDRLLAGAALLPLGVWLIHGSIDWFWEVPALSGPALGFLAMAGRLRAGEPAGALAEGRPATVPVRWAGRVASALALVAATLVLGIPYLALREITLGQQASYHDVPASLADFRAAHRLNPFMSDPGQLAGTVALVNGLPATASNWFAQATSKEPGSWYAWLGRSLAASAAGDVPAARRYAQHAARLDDLQVAVQQAVRRVGSRHPLTIDEALNEVTTIT